MNDNPAASGGIRQIENEEVVVLRKVDFEKITATTEALLKQVETLGGLVRLALPSLAGTLLYTQEVLEDEIDSTDLQIRKAKDVLSPKQAFDFGLQLGIDMDKALIPVLKKKKASEIFQHKTNRAAMKAAKEAAATASPTEEPQAKPATGPRRVKMIGEL